MEEDLGIETPPVLRLLIKMFRLSRPHDYDSMPFAQRLRTDTFLFMVEAISLVDILAFVVITCACFLLDIPMHGGWSVVACNVSGGLLGFITVFMVRNINHNMSKPLVLTAVTIFICLVASVIVSFNTTNMIEVFAFPVYCIPIVLICLVETFAAAIATCLVCCYYVAFFFFEATREVPHQVDMCVLSLQGFTMTLFFFSVFEFQRTATVRREATLSRRILEDATFEALMIFDDEHGLVTVNQQFVELTGKTLSAVRDPGALSALIKGVDFPELVASARLGTTRVIHDTFVIRGRLGNNLSTAQTNIPIDVLVRRLHTDPSRVAFSLRDMSARVEAEAAIRVAELADARARGKAAFLSTISHELRNPLNAVVGMTQIVENMDIGGEVRAAVGNIVTATRTVLGILHQLLDYGKAVEGAALEVAESFNLRTLVMETLALAALQVDDSKVQLFGSFDAGRDHGVVSDPMRVRQVLLNLLSNGIKYTSDGRVRVRVTLSNEEEDLGTDETLVHIAVEDTGQGIGQGTVDHVFGRFGRGDLNETGDYYGGYGLGLAICRDLVMAMKDGKIGVRSTEGVGSTFWFSFVAGSMDDDRPTTSTARRKAIRLPSKDKVASAITLLRSNHAALIASVTVHVLTAQTELGRWMGNIGAIWGFEVVVSATVEAAIAKMLPGVPSILYIDAALVSSSSVDIDEVRVDLPAGMPVVLVHSIHDAATAQALSDSVDGTLSTPLCEEKLIGSIVASVHVVADAVPTHRVAELVSMASTAHDRSAPNSSSLGRSMHRRRRDDSAWDEFLEVSSEVLEASSELMSSSSIDTLPAGDHPLVNIGDLRALVVEDDPLNLMVIRKLLSMSGVASIDVARNGAEGADAIMTGSYSLVLTDMHMPVMSGIEMMRTVAARAADDPPAQAALDRAYVVILSGSVLSASHLAEMEAAGVRDTLQKPVLRSDLVQVVEAARKWACKASM